MPERHLDQQTALVTGASSGIGTAISKCLADAGSVVVINYIGDQDSAEQIVNDIQSVGGRAIAIEADVSREEQVESMFRQAIETFGAVDILINRSS
ncbi:MAG: SDR family NAD(P)-dependent oxidoreductase [Candidatus Paceibacterota bacterium]